MLLNLKTEIARRKLSQAKIARAIGISDRAMSQKVTERTEFTRSEMYAIHKIFFSDVNFRYLFASDGEKSSRPCIGTAKSAVQKNVETFSTGLRS